MENSKQLKVLHIDSAGYWFRTEGTVCEFPLRIILNGETLITLPCSPGDLEALAAGYLASSGIIRKKEEIRKLEIDNDSKTARIETDASIAAQGRQLNGRDRFLKKNFSNVCISQGNVLSLYRRFQKNSALHRETSAAHSAALCSTGEILISTEDIGRHNAIDKIIGRCILEEIFPTDRILAISCRISSEIVLKAAMANIPILISKSGPTDRGVELARCLGITLVGFVYKSAMNVYSGCERINIRQLLA
jgi:FdhD protein